MKKLIILFFVIILITLYFIPFWNVFAFTETRSEHPSVHYIPMKKEKDFQIIFTHSIHLSDVIERYKVINDDQIQLVSMKYSDVAIGMPGYAEAGQTLIYEDGIYTLQYDRAILPDFTLYIADIDYKLEFEYGFHHYDLKKELVRGKSYLFEVKRISLYELMKGDKLNEREKK